MMHNDISYCRYDYQGEPSLKHSDRYAPGNFNGYGDFYDIIYQYNHRNDPIPEFSAEELEQRRIKKLQNRERTLKRKLQYNKDHLKMLQNSLQELNMIHHEFTDFSPSIKNTEREIAFTIEKIGEIQYELDHLC